MPRSWRTMRGKVRDTAAQLLLQRQGLDLELDAVIAEDIVG